MTVEPKGTARRASRKFKRGPTNEAEHARRVEFGKTYGAINASIGREIRAKRKAGLL